MVSGMSKGCSGDGCLHCNQFRSKQLHVRYTHMFAMSSIRSHRYPSLSSSLSYAHIPAASKSCTVGCTHIFVISRSTIVAFRFS